MEGEGHINNNLAQLPSMHGHGVVEMVWWIAREGGPGGRSRREARKTRKGDVG